MSKRGLPHGSKDIPDDFLRGKWDAAASSSPYGIALPMVIAMGIAFVAILVVGAVGGL